MSFFQLLWPWLCQYIQIQAANAAATDLLKSSYEINQLFSCIFITIAAKIDTLMNVKPESWYECEAFNNSACFMLFSKEVLRAEGVSKLVILCPLRKKWKESHFMCKKSQL